MPISVDQERGGVDYVGSLEPSVKFPGLTWFDTANKDLLWWNVDGSSWDPLRFRGSSRANVGDRGFHVGGYGGTGTSAITYITVSRPGDATSFGQISTGGTHKAQNGGYSNGPGDRGCFVGGTEATCDDIEVFTMSTPGDATLFSTVLGRNFRNGGTPSTGSNDIGFIIGGQTGNTPKADISLTRISTLVNAGTTGSLTVAQQECSAMSNGIRERAVKMSGSNDGIEAMSLATFTDAVLFDDLTNHSPNTSTRRCWGTSNDTNDIAVIAGGTSSGGNTTAIFAVNIVNLVSAAQVGDLQTATGSTSSCSNGVNDRMVTSTNISPYTMEYFNISATSGTAADFGAGAYSYFARGFSNAQQ